MFKVNVNKFTEWIGAQNCLIIDLNIYLLGGKGAYGPLTSKVICHIGIMFTDTWSFPVNPLCKCSVSYCYSDFINVQICGTSCKSILINFQSYCSFPDSSNFIWNTVMTRKFGCLCSTFSYTCSGKAATHW